jgi:hypothetical protein
MMIPGRPERRTGLPSPRGRTQPAAALVMGLAYESTRLPGVLDLSPTNAWAAGTTGTSPVLGSLRRHVLASGDAASGVSP